MLYEEMVDLGNGIILAKIEVEKVKEQDINARIMKPEMFQQLVANIKKRGTLESLPFCALVNEKIEIVSGHHRIKAAREAGLKTISVLLDVSGLSRSQIAAKQLAHNSISGFDDVNTLREIAKIITNVDDMLESYIGEFEVKDVELPSLIHIKGDLDWKQVSIVFLEKEMQDLKDLVSNLDQNPELLGIAHLQQFNDFVKVLKDTQKFEDVKNVSSAVHTMIEYAEKAYKENGYDSKKAYVASSRVLGGATVTKQQAETIKKAVDKIIKNGDAENKWQAIEYLCNEYLSR